MYLIPANSKKAGSETVYVTTADLVVSYKITNGNLFKEKDLERIGAEVNRACLTDDNKLVVARKEVTFN